MAEPYTGEGLTIPVRVDPAIRPYVVRGGMAIVEGHPLARADCPVCGGPLTSKPVSLVFVGRAPGERWTAASVAVHDECTGTSEVTDGR